MTLPFSLKGILFDLDDTLYSATPAYEKALKEVLAQFKQKPIDDLVADFYTARAEAKRRLPTGHTSSHNRIMYWKLFQERLTGAFNPTLCAELIEAYDRALAGNIQLLERERLLALKARLSLAIVTDETVLNQIRKLAALDPNGQIIEQIVISEEYGVEKPNPRLFEAALSKISCSASEVLMVGDHWEKDILGADCLGIHSWWITEQKKPRSGAKSLMGQGSLSEALDWIERHITGPGDAI